MDGVAEELDELLSRIDFSSTAQGKYKEVAELLGGVVGIDPDQVYVSFVSGGSKNARNRAQQAQEHHRVELLVLDDAETVEASAEKVIHLVEQGELEAIALVVPDEEDFFEVTDVLAAKGSATAGKFTQAFADAEVRAVEVTSPSSAGVDRFPSFSAADCELFSRTGGDAWNEVSDEDKALGKDISNRLKLLSGSEADVLDAQISWDSAVSRHIKQPTPGKPPTAHHDLWCCVYPLDAPTKSHALQTALIVSANGAELCFCLGSGQSAASNQKEAAKSYGLVRARLTDMPADLKEAIEEAVSGFDLRRSWRAPGTSNFDSLDEWLEFAASDQGAGASISLDFNVEQVEDEGAGLSHRFDTLAQSLAPVFEWLYAELPEATDESVPFTIQSVKDQAGDLELDDSVYATLVAALESGKHVLLTGPPGTGKTTLAEAVCRAATQAERTEGYTLTTATSDWTTYETIGGLRPTPEKGLEFRPGHLLEAIAGNRWLLVDELNRAPFDQAFGQLFTVLSGQAVVLPYTDPASEMRISIVPPGKVPPAETEAIKVDEDWRLVATMNVFDKDLLFEMSYALMRRFAFVEVPAPSIEVYETLIADDASDDANAATVAKALLDVRKVKEVGPASFRDLTKFLVERRKVDPDVSDSRLAFEGFYGYLLPQFEGIDGEGGRSLLSIMKPILDAGDFDRLIVTFVEVLGLDRIAILPNEAPSPNLEEDD